MFEQAKVYEFERSEAAFRRVGQTALWGGQIFRPELGVNDPVTHLEQFLESGEAAIGSIDEDLITDIAERKLKPTFINQIEFYRDGDDFVSSQNHFSMRRMTAITKDKFARGNLADIKEYKRAKIESKEVDRLNDWFDGAEVGDVFIVESMPLGEERYTIVRMHQKTGPGQLVEHVITLHNATTNMFNQLHDSLGVAVPDSRDELELLNNMYAYRPTGQNFENGYVAAFDSVLSSLNPGENYSFGLPAQEQSNQGDDVLNVRRQAALRSVYLDSLRQLGTSGGYANRQIISTASKLGCSFSLVEGGPITYDVARELLDYSLQSVAATFNRASKADLDKLATSQDKSAAADYAGQYGGAARAEGIRYDGACPSSSPAASEAAAIGKAHRHNQDPSQCGTCPKCSKEYFVDKKVYEAKILECNNCHEAITFDGKSVSREKLDRLHGRKAKSIGFVDGLGLAFERTGLEVKLEGLLAKQQSDQSEFEKRRGIQLIEEYQIRLEEIRYLTS